MEIQKIYFDMDGVLADFKRGVRDLCGMEPLDQSIATQEEEATMWKAISEVEHFYDKLEPMPGALEMFRALYDKYGDKCEILSAIPKEKRGIKNSGEDKKKWAARVLNPNLKVNIVEDAGEKKRFVRGPEYILIDDYKSNIDDWKVNGGSGILFEDAALTVVAITNLEK